MMPLATEIDCLHQTSTCHELMSRLEFYPLDVQRIAVQLQWTKQFGVMEDATKVFQNVSVDLDIGFGNILRGHIEIFLEVGLLFEIRKAHTHLKKDQLIVFRLLEDSQGSQFYGWSRFEFSLFKQKFILR